MPSSHGKPTRSSSATSMSLEERLMDALKEYIPSNYQTSTSRNKECTHVSLFFDHQDRWTVSFKGTSKSWFEALCKKLSDSNIKYNIEPGNSLDLPISAVAPFINSLNSKNLAPTSHEPLRRRRNF